MTNNLVQYSVGLLCCASLVVLFEHTPPLYIGALAYLVLANPLLAISLLVWMTRAGEAARVSALFFCVSPDAALTAWLLLDETLSPGLDGQGDRHRRGVAGDPCQGQGDALNRAACG